MRGVSKKFGGTFAIEGVNLTIEAGEIHALVGQNGSGKSTLIKVLAGIHAPESGGSIQVDGQDLNIPTVPTELMSTGVSFVHQDLGIIDDLSVTENICIGDLQPARFTRRIGWPGRRNAAASVLARIGRADIDTEALPGQLNAASRAAVAIARGMLTQQRGSGVIVLDEATRALPKEELRDTHLLVRAIAAEGGAVLMISHNLEEVMALSDRVTVLRDGRVVGGGLPTSELSEAEVARLMLGRSLDTAQQDLLPVVGSKSVSIVGLTGDQVTDVDLDMRSGEIVGITGLAGSGFEEIPYLLAGVQRAVGGSLAFAGQTVDLTRTTTSSCQAAGVALVPERRDRDGLAYDETVIDNITLPRVGSRGRPWFTGSVWQRQEARAVLTELDVRPADPDLLVSQLSGGNQQKVLLGKWLKNGPSLLVLHEPTQAVDVGARLDILTTLRELASQGMTILLASIEASDLAAVCDRVIVFADGQPIHELATREGDDIIDLIYAGPIQSLPA